MTTLALLKKFLCACFVEHDPEKGLALVTEDIQCYGIANHQGLSRIEDLKKSAATDLRQGIMRATLKIEEENQVSEDTAVLTYSLSLNPATVRGRISGSSRRTPEGNKLYFINNAALSPLQTLRVFEDMARSRRDTYAKDLFIRSIPGGLMGGYREPGFPYYFINDTMLQYLGYESEEDFVRAVDGLIENCFFEQDRDTVNLAVEEQLTATGTYDVEYRILKKDGSYLWVHDIGKLIVAEDGREAILSVCYDITAEKLNERFLEGLVAGINGDLSLLAVDLEQKRTMPIYVSQNMGARQGFTRAEYLQQYAQNSMDCVYSGDRQRVWEAVCEGVRSNAAPSVSFRMLDKDKKLKWVNASFAKHGERNGMPVILALFTSSTIQNELQIHTLNQNGIGIAAIDAVTHEVYFANDAIFRMLGAEPMDYTNKLCPDILAGCGGSCKNCGMHTVQKQEALDKTLAFNGKYLSLHAERREWAGKSVVSIYATDVTERVLLQRQMDDLFENLPGGVALYQWDGKKLKPRYVSNGFSDFYGENKKDVLAQSDNLTFDVVHPDDRPGLQAFIRSSLEKDGENLIYRYRVWNKDKKEYLWIQLTGKVKCRPDGTSVIYTNYADVDAEIKAAEAVRKEEELLEKTCRLANIWMFYYNPQTKQIRLSKTLQEDFKLPATIENFPEGFFAYPIIAEENRDLYRRMVQRVDAGENIPTEMPVKTPDGADRMVRFDWYVTQKKDGKIVEIAGLPVDITKEMAERKRIEKECQKLLGGDKMLTAYSVTDLQKKTIVEAKNCFLDAEIQTGDSCEEFDAKVTPLLLTQGERTRYLEMRDPAYAIRQYEKGVTEWTADMRWKNREGAVRWQRSVYSILENSDTGTLYLYVYLYDVMNEKMAQILLEGIQSDLYLKAGVLSLTTGQIYDYAQGPANRRLRNSDCNIVRAEYLGEDVPPEDEEEILAQNSLENVKKKFQSGQKNFYFTHRTRENGTLHYHQVLYSLVPHREDVCIVVVRDITNLVTESERKNAELQKALATAKAATKAKSEFLSRMSHEIRTPMNAIMGMTAIAQDNKSDFLQVTDCLNRIDSASKYLLTLINDILEMSRIESGKTTLSVDRFDFSMLMEGISTVAEPLAQKSEVRLEIINRTENGAYYGDRVRIQQIMLNLLGNALKFTKKGGRVRFAVSAAEDTDTVTNFEFMVEDTGIGMSEAFMQKMFEPFTQEDSTTTSQYGGSGLGLAISKSLVEAMSGTIAVESMVGIGTSFTVRIPLQKAQNTLLLKAEKSDVPSQGAAEAILKGKRVLMAEDHPMNVMIAKKLLERKGMLITVAENGKVAVEMFRASAPREYDAILMDIRMPVMDGLEASRQIRALERPDAKTVPIIAMTANALEEDRKNSKAAGMDEHLSKPIEPNRMYQTLAGQIARKKG